MKVPKSLKSISTLILLFFIVQLSAQVTPRYLKDYTESHAKAKAWNSKDEVHSGMDYPEEWNNYSAVYLTYSFRTEFREHSPAFLKRTFLSHIRVKLLDDAAVENFSEIYSEQPTKTKPKIAKYYLGIKVVKPNGKEIIIDKKEFVVDEDGNSKLAIPNLEVGDILDYYRYSYRGFNTSLTHPLLLKDKFPIQDKYPIKNFEYTILTDDQWNVKFTSGKNGFDIKEEVTKNKDRTRTIKYSIEESDVPALESQIWHKPYISAPYVKAFVYYQSKAQEKKEVVSGETFRVSSLDEEQVKNVYQGYYKKGKNAQNEYGEFKRYLKKQGITTNSQEANLQEYFKFIRHKFMNMHYVYDRFNNTKQSRTGELMGHIRHFLSAEDIPYQILIVSSRNNGLYEDILSTEETFYVIKVDFKEPIYITAPNPFTPYNYLPWGMEGVNAFVLGREQEKKRKLEITRYEIPVSEHVQNAMYHKADVSLLKDSKELHAKTKVTLSGYQIGNYPFQICDWQNMIWNENRKYGTKLWGYPEDHRGKDKIKFQQYHDDNREIQKENLEYFANNHYDMEIQELINPSAELNSPTGEAQNLEVNFEAKLENIVKKVGPNYLIKIGQLVGGQVSPDEDEKRIYPVCMDYPRMYNYQINFELPAGYSVEGLEDLNNNIENETGHFKSSAKVEGNILKIVFEKVYKNNFEPTENWEKMKEFLIPAYKFNTKEILLKK